MFALTHIAIERRYLAPQKVRLFLWELIL